MGREVRRVPKGWEHPQDERGHYKPLYNQDFATAAREWMDNALAWDNGTHEDLVREPDLKQENPFYWQWHTGPPEESYYRPVFTSEPTCYQVYETVSEGTPTSPVFETLDELIAWLVSQGYSERAARNFATSGWAPSFVMSAQTGFVDGITAGGIL